MFVCSVEYTNDCMHVHTDGRLLFLRPHQREGPQDDRIAPKTLLGRFQDLLNTITRSSCKGELTEFRLQQQLVKFKMQTGLLSNSEQYFRGVAVSTMSLVDVRDNTQLTPALETTWRPWRQLGHITETTAPEESQRTPVEL